MKIFIKNMACESCKVVVKEALEELNLHPEKVELGMAETKEDLDSETKEKLNQIIQKVGLEIVESKGGILIEKIKHYCQEYVNNGEKINYNLSEYLQKKLDKDYNYLSNAFSEVTSTTIIMYVNLLKMEKAKEMILFEEHNFTEIATKLNFSNLSTFSALFKKITGFTPSYFKKLKEKRRKAIQNLTKDLKHKN
ncbi:helix-turn-helix domain-containing protein [Flavobacterium sp. NRK F7]|uniref:helix-turn-helix domain-containing protein n=1 Tax=Flavobacterium sp. NRK F7 TaxID=2954930 RepID=UPI0020909D4F|nr:helix-turn-helix domain-containing protein [Flavobacterium sp. NRK F7]MCO6163161.1 helix-turn-helix domain-containing protein [Flavobacterium sp. NRK F7]